MLNYKIEGGNLPVVICQPEANQTICTERGSMCWMSPNMNMETNAGGFKKAIGRLFSGESIFLNEFTPVGGSGVIAFASRFPGSIIPFEITEGNGIIVQKTGFLAMEKGLDLSIYFNKRLGAGFFGGEGFIMQRISGNGLAFVEIDGHCEVVELGVGESIIVDTGNLAAMSESCTMDIQAVKGVKNVLFGGAGIFHTKVTGPGKVYMQSMPISEVADLISSHITVNNSSSNNNDGGFTIKLGN